MEHEQWSKPDLSEKQYVYVWADGIHAKVRLEDDGGKKQCLLVLMTFYDFPAEDWSHLRTTNPIESTFATIRLRHRRTRGRGTRRTSLTMMFKLAQSASKKWRRLNCHEKIAFVIEGRSFKDGIMHEVIAA